MAAQNSRLHDVVQKAFFEQFGTLPTPEGHLYPFAMSVASNAVRAAIAEIEDLDGAIYVEAKAELVERLTAMIPEERAAA